jgi:endogenous inhibitor of DNA gyrase (YacG/DUF329 family)
MRLRRPVASHAAVHECPVCHAPLDGSDNPAFYWCSEDCQHEWMAAQQALAAPDTNYSERGWLGGRVA